MKRVPKHLPPHKQQELNEIVAAIRAHHDVEMIILFGSHARGDWVEDEYEEDHITYEYRSDYDILIITADKESERTVAYDSDLKHDLEPGAYGTRVNYIVHTIQHVNQMLAERRFFFMDILKEGYLLHDSGNYKLARPPKELPPDEMLRHAEEYFEEWMESADGFWGVARVLAGGHQRVAQVRPSVQDRRAGGGGIVSAWPRASLHLDSGREFRGGQRQVLYLLQGLIQRGQEVLLACPRDSVLGARAGELGIPVLPLTLRSGFDFPSAVRLARTARDAGFDLVHAHDARSHAVARVAQGVCRSPALADNLFVTRRSIGTSAGRLTG